MGWDGLVLSVIDILYGAVPILLRGADTLSFGVEEFSFGFALVLAVKAWLRMRIWRVGGEEMCSNGHSVF